MSKIAVITGGSRGLGKDMAINVVQKGLDVIITYNNNAEEANKVVSEIENLGQKAAALQLSVDNQEGQAEFFKQLQNILNEKFNGAKVDFWVNNAGIGLPTTFGQTDEATFDTLMNIHVKSPYFLVQNALSLMNDGGGIINIGTGLTRFSMVGYSVYAAMKSALTTLSQYWALELEPRQIRVNTVAPGAIATDFGGGAVRDNEQINQHVAHITALGRVGNADDIGSVVAFLCTDDAKWINGQRIEVSGGMNL